MVSTPQRHFHHADKTCKIIIIIIVNRCAIFDPSFLLHCSPLSKDRNDPTLDERVNEPDRVCFLGF